MSKLLDNHITVSTLTGTMVLCRLLTKTRDCIPHKNDKNGDAAELLNGANGENGDVTLNGEMVEWCYLRT